MPFGETDIRWCDYTWNPTHGCSKTSEGCANCYAERVSRRFGHTDEPWTIHNAAANVQLKWGALDDRLGEPAWVFVNSMSDLYHEEIPRRFIEAVFGACREMSRSAFQILTKHGPDTDRPSPHPPDNVMLGVSVEAPDRRYRLEWLREQPAMTRFVSFEPLDPYSQAELVDILASRVRHGLDADRVTDAALSHIADCAAGDAREAIALLRRAARQATETGRDITRALVEECAEAARRELRDRHVRSLGTHQRTLYDVISGAGSDGIRASALHKAYEQRVQEPKTRRTRRRYLDSLERYELITTEGSSRGTRYKPVRF